MFKYIKWELKSLMKKYTNILIVVIAIIWLMLIIPFDLDNLLSRLVFIAFIITECCLLFATFIFGTKKVVDTFRKPTFMLESMISLPPYKILLAKYLLALILNIVCGILSVLAMSVITYKFAGAIAVLELFNIDINFDTLETLVTLIISSTLFTSTVTMCYVLAKSLFPKKKGTIVLGIIIWYIGFSILIELFDSISGSIWLFNLLELAIISISYLGTLKLIENKLEIYN